MSVRRGWFRVACLVALIGATGGCALSRPPSTNPSTVWSPDQAVLPRAEFQGQKVTVRNVRLCHYRTAEDYTVEHYDKTFDLAQIDSVDFIVVPFPGASSLAHTMVSFGLAGREYLGVSVEVRRQKGEEYSPLLGALGHYELMYVVGDERDLIGLRSNFRLYEVYLYHTRATAEQARALFVDMMTRANQVAAKPELYNTLTNNCTTNILRHVQRIAPGRLAYDYRILLPGYSDRWAYDHGLLDTQVSFEETKARSLITRQAYLYRDQPDFSALIRR